MNILKEIGVSAVTTIAVTYFILKTWFKSAVKLEHEKTLSAFQDQLKRKADAAIEQVRREHNEKLESHKAQLNTDSQIRIERERVAFQTLIAQNGFRFSRVFDKTAEIIAKAYEKLVNSHTLIAEYIVLPGEPRQEQRIQKAHQIDEALQGFKGFFLPNEIYLERQTSERISKFLATLRQQASTSDMLSAMGKLPDMPDASIQRMEAREQMLFDRIPELLMALQDEFRRVLGLPTNESASKPTEPVAK